MKKIVLTVEVSEDTFNAIKGLTILQESEKKIKEVNSLDAIGILKREYFGISHYGNLCIDAVANNLFMENNVKELIRNLTIKPFSTTIL